MAREEAGGEKCKTGEAGANRGKPKALIAMSGGVDSSVAALLAQRMGYECVGVTMKLIACEAGGKSADGSCGLRGDEAEDVAKERAKDGAEEGKKEKADKGAKGVNSSITNATQAAAGLGIDHIVLDYTAAFRTKVIEPFVRAYEAGLTPNPCIDCNTCIKFGALYDYAITNGFDKLVTGHYARIIEDNDGANRLARGVDMNKDQSYFLYSLRPEMLEHIAFPLGELTKGEARAIAKEAGLAAEERPESQDICFVPEDGHAEFIKNYRGAPPAPGYFVDTFGGILGAHKGITHYTIGQRKGLGVALGRPAYIKEIRPETNEIVLADKDEVLSSSIEVSDVVWFNKHWADSRIPDKSCELENLPKTSFGRAQVAIRYRTTPVWGAISASDSSNLTVTFESPVRAPAAGQAAVFYDGDVVLGGGRIL